MAKKLSLVVLACLFLFSCREVSPIAKSVRHWAYEYGLAPNLVYSVIRWESGYRNTWRSDRRVITNQQWVKDAIARSPMLQRRGRIVYRSCGAMQVNYMTAYHWGFTNSFDDLMCVDTNIRIGCQVLFYYVHKFGDVKEGLAAYNGGPEAVWRMRRTGYVPEYVRLVYGTWTNYEHGRVK